jgi:hypothetical protein
MIVALNPNTGSIAGTWTYRSFLSDPDLAADFDTLEFGRGNITVFDAPMGVFAGRIYGDGWGLDLNGSIGYGTPWSVRFQGEGVVGGAQWIYDYIGWVVPAWPNGISEVPAMVGSIVRTLPHPAGGAGTVAPAGVVAQWVAVWQSSAKTLS